MDKILLLGARGYLGSFLTKYAPKNIKLILSSRDNRHIPNNFEFVPLDLTIKKDVMDKIKEIDPDIIINCAANALPDVAEEKKEWTYDINVNAVKYIIEACRNINSKLIHISTDYVFSGKKGNYKEDDITNPINYYGFTKLKAEEIIIQSGLEYLICRTSVLYGLKFPYQRRVLFYSVYNQLQNNKILKVTEQIGSPTLVDDLAMCIYNMLDFKKSGIYHTSGSEAISRISYAKRVAKIFDLNENLIKKVDSLNRIAPRPKNSSLNTEKLHKDFNVNFRNLEQSLKFIKNSL